MRNSIRSGLALLLLVLGAGLTPAHYNILLPSKHSIKKDESVTLLYRWGHPFEHQLFDAPKPKLLLVIGPDGKIVDLTKQLEKVKHPTPGKKEVVAYQLKFTPDQRGDYTFVLHTPFIFLEEDGEFVQDVVKVVLHVQAQKNWDGDIIDFKDSRNGPIKVLPLTRPYGLQPGMAFQAQFWGQSTDPNFIVGPNPLNGLLVDIERFNPIPPKKLPPDEHITRTCKTDLKGSMTCTLTDPGWWCITGMEYANFKRKHNGKDCPVRLRATLWVHVDASVGN